jgi:hypothetical protein
LAWAAAPGDGCGASDRRTPAGGESIAAEAAATKGAMALGTLSAPLASPLPPSGPAKNDGKFVRLPRDKKK